MKIFLQRVGLFFLVIVIIAVAGILMPATPRASNSLLFAKPAKDSLLLHTPAPRLILIGGSSMSMSIDSQLLKDSLKLNPINTGIHAAIGLVYMLDHTARYVKKGDVVLIAPEYDQFYGDFAYGGQELFRTITDVGSVNLDELHWKQFRNISEFVPKYVISKFKPSEYERSHELIYVGNAFNKYGDCSKRSDVIKGNALVFESLHEPFNPEIINHLKSFEKKIKAKGATMILTFPAFEQRSFRNQQEQIKEVESAFHENGFTVIANPRRYCFPNHLMYDTPYHLSTKGIAIRTQMLIRDLIDEAHLKRQP